MEVRLYAKGVDDVDTILRLLDFQGLLEGATRLEHPLLAWRFRSDELISEWRLWLAGAQMCGLVEGGYVRLA